MIENPSKRNDYFEDLSKFLEEQNTVSFEEINNGIQQVRNQIKEYNENKSKPLQHYSLNAMQVRRATQPLVS